MRSPEYFRALAEEARAMVSDMSNKDAQVTMLRIAKQYDSLAEVTERLDNPEL